MDIWFNFFFFSLSMEICRKDIRLMSPFSKEETGHGS